MSRRAGRALRWLPAIGALGVPLAAQARDFRVNDIPNGTVNGCLNCHLDTSGTSFTPFGSDVRLHLIGSVPTAQKHVDWSAALCNRDSDGDGASNALELADPNCTWKAGQPDPSGAVTNPGDPTSFPPTGSGGGTSGCGNGVIDDGEDCDGMQLSKSTCGELGLGNGDLSCLPTCMFDTSHCSLAPTGSTTGAGGGSSGGSSSGCSVAVDPIGAFGPAMMAASAFAVRALRRRRRRSAR